MKNQHNYLLLREFNKLTAKDRSLTFLRATTMNKTEISNWIAALVEKYETIGVLLDEHQLLHEIETSLCR